MPADPKDALRPFKDNASEGFWLYRANTDTANYVRKTVSFSNFNLNEAKLESDKDTAAQKFHSNHPKV